MSTVPETITARQCGAEVVALSLVTNLCAGMESGIGHEDVMRIAAKKTPVLIQLILKFLEIL